MIGVQHGSYLSVDTTHWHTNVTIHITLIVLSYRSSRLKG